jgi:hypothetical protein
MIPLASVSFTACGPSERGTALPCTLSIAFRARLSLLGIRCV